MGISTQSQQSAMDAPPAIPPRCRSTTQIRHFNGTSRRSSEWDGLRRDTQLWCENEDCLVYFYSYQASQRGASLRIPLNAVKKLKCAVLMGQCLRKSADSQSVPHRYGQPDRRYLHLRNDYLKERSTYELYIPAPPDCSRAQAFSYHLTTRNLFAYAMDFPLVGERLSSALVDLWNRLQEWNIPIKLSDLTTYLEKQGYMDFTESTEHSLACLQLAEAGRLRSVWIESFVHCVGMQSRLDISPEFAGLSKTTSALILRAALEMDLHITRVVKAVGMFLEHELSAAFIGLSKPIRDHLDFFRSFLHSFYVNRFGYFPPRITTPWNKRPWTSMYNDFQYLYNYLVDTDPSAVSHHDSTGGFCVIQNVKSFDIRHGYQALPHPLPLLPQQTMNRKSSAKGLRSLGSSLRRNSSGRSSISSRLSIEMASNPPCAEASRNPLIHEYRRFENELATCKSKLDLVEARKVRWLLIYGVLQMLGSVVRAPAEVRDTETPSYPCCALTTGGPSWLTDDSVDKITASAINKQASNEKMLRLELPEELRKQRSNVSARPAEPAKDLLSSSNLSRQNSSRSQTSAVSVPAQRSSAARSSVQSLIGSLTNRHTHRMSLPIDVIRGSANAHRAPTSVVSLPEQLMTPPPRNPIRDFDFGFSSRRRIILDEQLLEEDIPPTSPVDPMPSPSAESDSSEISHHSSGRSSCQTQTDANMSPLTEYSSWGQSSSRSNSVSSDTSLHIKPLSMKRMSTVERVEKLPGNSVVDADTRTSKSMPLSPPGKGHLVVPSADTTASSVYAEENVQAAEIDELHMRGRQRMRGLNDLSTYGIILGEGNVW